MHMNTKSTIAAALIAITAMTGHAQTDKKMESGELKKVTFGAGCFWCTEAVFLSVKGVSKVVSGYSGGTVKSPSYREVCTGMTGHAEVTQITYDPKAVSFEDLLEVFWNTHDPTTLNRQGADEGTQYRSVVFYNDEEQKKIAEQYKKQLEAAHVYKNPIVTEISPLINFYPAEDYHQNYFELNPNQGYCQYVIRPKVDKFKKQFASKLKK
jgi:peptide-methionine (S)-S-oxide reductase